MNDADDDPLPQLRLLGAPRLLHAGRAAPLAIRKLWGLLALLAVEGRATRSRLAGLLWGELDEAAARRNLRRELHRLREAGLAGMVVGDDQFLELGPCQCDLHQFEGALADNRLVEAVAGYGGPLLEGLDGGGAGFDDWLRLQRDRLHHRWHQAARRLAVAQEERGEIAAALATVLRMLDVDALQEADYRHAMRLHGALGERESALLLYERCRRSLGRELGLRPMAETVALAEQIRCGEALGAQGLPTSPEAPSGPSASPAAAPVSFDAPLVGRETELAAIADRPGRLLVCGAAGLGKTRLAIEWSKRHGPAQWFSARSEDASTTFGAPARWLQAQAGAVGALPPPQRRELGLLWPAIAPPGAPPDVDAGSQRMAAALGLALETLAGSARMLVFDDVQWLDDASFDALLRWRPGPSAAAATVVLLARAEELDGQRLKAIRAWAGPAPLARIELTPLAPAATLTLVRHLSGSPHGQRFAQRLHEATAGHPLFLLQTLRHLLDSGWLQTDAQGLWHTAVDADTADYAELPVAPSVREAVLARVERLGDGACRLLEAAACVRGPIRYASVARATALTEWEALDAFERVLAAGLMEADGEETYRFAHDLVAQTLAGSLGVERRRLIHRALALAVEAGDASPSVLAHHWAEGGEPARAAPWWARAAQQAEDRGAHDEALALNRLAVQAGLAPAVLAEAQLQRARLLRRQGNGPAVGAALADADAAARASGDLALLCKGQLALARHLGHGDLEAAAALVDAVLAQPTLPALLRSQAHQQRAALARQRGDLGGCIDECRQALVSLPPGQWRSRGEITFLQGAALMFTGQSEPAELQFLDAIAAFTRAGNDAGRVRALCTRASLAADRGAHAVSRALCEEALAMAEVARDVGLQRTVILNLLRSLVAQGEAAQALARVEQGLALSPGFSHINEEQALLEARFAVALLAGELGAALQGLPALLDASRRASDLYRQVSGLLAPVEALMQLDGQREQAAALVDEARALVRGRDLVHLVAMIDTLVAELALHRQDLDGALAAAETALASPGLRAQDRPRAVRVRALVGLARGDTAAGAELALDMSDLNPEQATLAMAARLRHDPAPAVEAEAWLLGGKAPPLESLSLALALHEAGVCSKPAQAHARAVLEQIGRSLRDDEPTRAALFAQFGPLRARPSAAAATRAQRAR